MTQAIHSNRSLQSKQFVSRVSGQHNPLEPVNPVHVSQSGVSAGQHTPLTVGTNPSPHPVQVNGSEQSVQFSSVSEQHTPDSPATYPVSQSVQSPESLQSIQLGSIVSGQHTPLGPTNPAQSQFGVSLGQHTPLNAIT